jgi:hypothetical protein
MVRLYYWLMDLRMFLGWWGCKSGLLLVDGLPDALGLLEPGVLLSFLFLVDGLLDVRY